MNIVVKIDVDTQKILDSRGLGEDKAVWLFAAGRYKTYADPYVPFHSGSHGHLKDQVDISATSDGAVLKYTSVYAHYQWEGRTMGPNVLTKRGWRSFKTLGKKTYPKKVYTGGTLTHSGERVSHWDEKTKAEKGDTLMKDIAAYVGGKVD